jgi:hypothetical protein
MDRTQATKLLRDLLNEHKLTDWHVRLTMDMSKPFLGLCSHKDKCIILNAFHIDTHPDVEVINTIRHEVAHALTPGHGHDLIWIDKAKELGCDNTLECATYGFNAAAIDAIRSGADLQVTFEEQVIRTPKYTVTRLQDKCPTCNKVAKAVKTAEFDTPTGRKKITTLECHHVIIVDADSTSPFHKITFDGNENCAHAWNGTICSKCNAKKLFPYQIEGARALEKANGRFAIFDEMGLGKTIQALAYLKFNKEKSWPFLWVTKSSTVFPHSKEILRVLGPTAFPQVLKTGKDKPIPGLNLICSYDLFRRLDLEQFKHIKCLILDECQAIKNPDSTRTQCIRRVAKHASGIIPLSGTPWKNRGSEFFVVLNMLDPKMFYSYEDFKRRHVAAYESSDGSVKEGGIRNPEKFKELISSIAIRRERTEVMPELPVITRAKVLCEVPDHARKVYTEEEDKLYEMMKDSIIDGTENSFENKAKVMQSLMIMKQIVGIAKVPATVEYVKEFLEETDRKLVVFVHHIKCGELILGQLTEYCEQNGYQKPLVISSSMNSYERGIAAEKFNGPNHRLLIASTLAAGEGLNLQTCADCVIHERQWNPANEEQAEGRFIRIGQKATSVNAVYFHGDDTVDSILDDIVEKKRMFFHEAMNKGQTPMWSEADVVNEIVKAIVKKRKDKKL